ncbi:HAD-IA family hydrolase [Shigella flexneri]
MAGAPGLRRYFDAVVAADHVKHHKPAPDTFLLCAQRMGVQLTQCVVFEDADFGIRRPVQQAWTLWMFACCE